MGSLLFSVLAARNTACLSFSRWWDFKTQRHKGARNVSKEVSGYVGCGHYHSGGARLFPSETPRQEISAQVFGSFVTGTTQNGIENKATNSGGGLGSYRFFFSEHHGIEAELRILA
jgi:hypothetical protein